MARRDGIQHTLEGVATVIGRGTQGKAIGIAVNRKEHNRKQGRNGRCG